ncbi:MAG TPA: histidinol dehydrogenase [Candidatus Sulfobium mesophilum]|nr:histidinol dehydrogenase [Candidatus Sulfobium mesophilum]
MKVINNEREFGAFLTALKRRGSSDNPAIARAVKTILEDVRKSGDEAVLKYTRRFDDPKAARLRLSPREIERHAGKADPEIVKALRISAQRIRKFHGMQTEKSWSFCEAGSVLGQSIRPLGRVGVYVPGGTAAYPSTVLMNVIPAQVAGVKEIVLCVPAVGGQLNPYVMAAIKMLGVSEVYRIGGAQAIGAMAYGTKGIKKVDKIVGPGNIYVATAKRMVFGLVDIDMIAGPSEILIIADDRADAPVIAADLLSQAEHDELASSVLITDSKRLALAVSDEVQRQLSILKRKKIAEASISRYGAIVLTKDLRDAVSFSNRIAPEHLEIMTEAPEELLPLVDNAGAVFLGHWTPEALGDYAAGPNHTLPTNGTSRFFSPLGVYDFYKRSSLVGFTKKGFQRLSKVVEALADSEGLDAHANTIRIRKEMLRQGTSYQGKD